MNVVINENVWHPVSETTEENSKQWHDGNGVALVLYRLGFDEALFSRLSNETAVREYYRDTLASDGIGIVQCDLSETNGYTCVNIIGKMIVEGQPARYVGSIAIPMREMSIVLSLFSQEEGITGVRDTAIFAKLAAEGHDFIPDDDTGEIVGWAADPYFPDYDGPCLRNLSELEEYDTQFPEHPLSKVRHRLNELLDDIDIVETTRETKPWWRLW